MFPIYKNAARCRKCDTYIESKYRHDYVGCKCGACAVDGGTAYLRRTAQSFEEMEDLTEFVITWKDVLDCKLYVSTIGAMADLTRTTGYECFLFNDNIYLLTRDKNNFIRTGKFKSDLKEDAPPCIITSKEVFA